MFLVNWYLAWCLLCANSYVNDKKYVPTTSAKIRLRGMLCVCCLFSTDQRQNHVTKTADHLHRRLPRQWLQVSWRFRSTFCESLPGYTALSSFDSSVLSQFPEALLFDHLILQVDSTTRISKDSIKSFALRTPLERLYKKNKHYTRH